MERGFVWRRGRWVVHGLLLLGLAACGGVARNAAEGAGSGGASFAGAGGVALTTAGQAGAGGAAAVPHLPGATADEETILDPLFLEPAEFEGSSLQQLVDLAGRIGLARGYAMCRCVRSADRPPESVAELLSGCAKDEAAPRDFTWFPSAEQGPRTNQDLARCLGEESLKTPGLEDALRCELERYQKDGRGWLQLCSVPHAQGDSSAWPPATSDACLNADVFDQLVVACQQVVYCADGKRVSPGRRCSGTQDCQDASDEQGCFEFVGHDMLQCGDAIMSPWLFCESPCANETPPPLCNEALPDRVLCAAGGDVSKYAVCDRKADCADGTDELYCLR